MLNINRTAYLYIAWVIALTGTIGSLVMSEVLGWTPCVLCWYQRIALYPLALIIPIGILRKDHQVYQYILPLSCIGMIIAFYHWLLQIGLIKESATPCLFGVSCAIPNFNYFGFINIPFLSMLAFGAILVLTFLYMKAGKKI
jgi:disulfide bond formation protein DsbB